MNEHECRELYEYILKQLGKFEVREDIIREIESLRYRDVLNDKKTRTKRKTEERTEVFGQMSMLDLALEEEVGKTEIRRLTGREQLLKAIEILEVYALTIPSISHKIKQNLVGKSDINILWRTDDNNSIDGFELNKMEYFDYEEIQKGRQILREIIEEVKADGDNK